MEIRAHVLDSSNTAQNVQDLKLVVSLPTGTLVTPTLNSSGQFYNAELPDTSLTGVYTLTFSGKLGPLPINEQHTVNVQPLPWMTYITPKTGSLYSGTVSVQAQIMMGAGQINVSQFSKQLQIVGHLIASNGQEVDTVVMRPVASGVFSGTLLADECGRYPCHSPKFTVLARDGRQVVFTTNPRAMKKMRLIQRGDKVVDISRLSSAMHTEMGFLWQYAQEKRAIEHVTAPVSAHWYVIMCAATAKVLTTRKGLLRPGYVPFIEQSLQLPDSRDNA